MNTKQYFNPIGIANIARQSTLDILEEDSFQVNIHAGINDTFTLKDECKMGTTILEVKQKIMKQKKLKDINNIQLKYNDEIMENTKTLGDYDITDNRHLILMSVMVQKSLEEPTNMAPLPPDFAGDETAKLNVHVDQKNVSTLDLDIYKQKLER